MFYVSYTTSVASGRDCAKMSPRLFYTTAIILGVLQLTLGDCQTNLQPNKGRLRYDVKTDGDICRWTLPTSYEECAGLVIKIESADMEFEQICRSRLYIPMENGITSSCQFSDGCYILYKNYAGSQQQILLYMQSNGLQCTRPKWHRFNGTIPREIKVETEPGLKYSAFLELSYEFIHCTKVAADDFTVSGSLRPRQNNKKPKTKKILPPSKSCDGLVVAVAILAVLTTCSLLAIAYLYLKLRSFASRNNTNNIYSFAKDSPDAKQNENSQRDELPNELYHMEDLQTGGNTNDSPYTFIKS